MYQLFIFKSSANNINGKIIKITSHIFKPSNFSICFLYRCKRIAQTQKFLFAVVRPIPIRYLQALLQGLQNPVVVYTVEKSKIYFDRFSFVNPLYTNRKRRVSVVLVYFAAISGKSRFNAVVSIRELVTAL